MTTFQRARSEEQREARRQSILDAAAAMLTQMPVADVTLNELSRRVGLAKSNVLRYFESREAVLLELLDAAWQDWLAEVAADLAGADLADVVASEESAAGAGRRPVAERGDQVAAILAASLAVRPVLCDLLSAQAGVLERNVSARVAAEYKRATMASIAALGRLIRRRLPELGEAGAGRLAAATVLTTAALWPNTQPSAAMLAAYDADPALAAMRLDFTTTMTELLQVLTSGLLARSGGAVAEP
jgi:AcrR family transcriptional regulator